MRKNTGRQFGFLRRVCAFALILMLSLQLLPGAALADDDGGDGSGSGSEWKTLDNTGKPASSGKAVTNTYIFEVSCGTRQGGGTADNVLYFIISYTSRDNQKRTVVLVPHEDALTDGFAEAEAQGNRDQRRADVKKYFGYSTADLDTKEALGSLATDQYMFTTPDAIGSIDQIQVFGRRDEDHGNWSCQGMRIYRVDTLYGLEMVGWYSDQGYIDFDGALICRVEMPAGGVTFRWTGKAGMYTLTPGTANGKVVNTGDDHPSQRASRVVFRIDLADVAGAGFESLVGNYDTGSRTKISDLKFCEAAAMIIRYRDAFGCIREISIGVVVNTLGQVMEVLGDAEIAEFAQQGDSLAIPLMLPDFESLESVKIILGEKEAAEAAHLITGTIVTKDLTYTPMADGVYTISPANDSSRLMSLNSSPMAGANVITSKESNPGLQRWKLKDAGEGYFFIMPAISDTLVLDAAGHSVANSSNVAVYNHNTTSSDANQKWKITETKDGYYSIVSSMDNGQCVDDSGYDHNVRMWKSYENNNQIWRFTNVHANVGVERTLLPDNAVLSDPLRSARVARSETDDISYICIAAYREVTAQVCLEGATLRTRFIMGTPLQYTTATSLEGINVQATQLTQLSLRIYEDGAPLTPKDRMERYLVTMSTDNVPNAGTAADIYLQFTYISVKDKELTSSEYRVRDYAKEFYGEWPGNVEDFAYNYGLRDGGTIRFIIPLQGVQEFKSVSVRLDGDDEWQFTGIELAFVRPNEAKTGDRSISPRLADWADIAVTGLNNHPQGLFSHLVYTRQVDTEEPCFTVGTVYDEEEERPDPNETDTENPEDGTENPEDEWKPGTLIQDDGETYVFDGESQDVTKKEDVPWDELRHYMTYDDTLRDLGFTKERCLYTVSVQVAGKTVNAGNDDCGSKNLFYFRLVFEHGNSGCTLANQQIVGDAFGTGELVQFKIPTSQDYGEVVAVQVIPDSQDSNSDIYDKLQIEEISVTRDSVNAVSPTWTAKIAASEDEGWVGIDYRDPGQMGGTSVVEGKTLDELATTFPITETSYSTNLLVSITTASYETGVQFSGGIRMDLNFINAEGRMEPKPISGFDVVAAMNSYGGLTGSKERKYKLGGETKTETASYYVSDNRYQFLPGSKDSFIVNIKNVYQLTDMALTVYSDVVTHWTIKDVTIYQLNGQGIRYLNPSGSYAYRYHAGEEPTPVAHWDLERLTTPLAVFDATQNSSMQPIKFALNSETIKLSEDAAKWSSKISRVPNSHNDTMNLILYPAVGGGAADPADYDVTAAVRYTDLMTTRTLQVSTGQMRRSVDDAGRTIFYATGLGASNLNAIEGVDWSATLLRSSMPQITNGVLQVVRGGVLIDSYPLMGMGYSLTPAVGNTAVSTQRLLLQVSEDTKKQSVRANECDLAAALYFRTDDPTHAEYRSRYVFLSDMGITEVKPGQLLELDFSVGNVGEFVGVNIVSMGKLDMNIDSLYLADQDAEGTVLSQKSYPYGITPELSPARYNFDGETKLVNLTIVTAEDESMANSGTDGPVRMVVGYVDIYGESKTQTYENIRPYIVSGDKFSAGSMDTVRMLIPNMAELRWIELEPKSEHKEETAEGTASMASWKLRQVSASVGLEDRSVTRVLDQRIMEDAPLHIVFSDIVLVGTVYVAEAGGDLSQPLVTVGTGHGESVTVDSGADVFVTVRVSGSDEGFTARLSGLDPITGEEEKASLDPTHGYSTETLDMLYTLAGESVENAFYEQEKESAQHVMDLVQSVRNSAGRFYADQVRLTTPHNYTGAKMKYRITVCSEEEPNAYFTLDVIIRNEPNELADAIANWSGIHTAGTVYVRSSGDASEEKLAVLDGETLSQLLDSGSGVTIVPHVGDDVFDAVIREYDPATGATGAPRLHATHGYSEEELKALEDEALDSLRSSFSTDAERAAARDVLTAVVTLRDTDGSFEITEENIVFTAPGNFTGGVLYYRINVISAQTGDGYFTVDVSVKPETNPLDAAVGAWRASRSEGTLSVLDGRGRESDTVRLMKGETHAQMLSSGQSLYITPRSSGSFEASVRSLDPATGATGTANLEASTGYSTEELYSLRNEARTAMSDDNATDAETRAAEAVVRAIDTIRNTDGDYEITDEDIVFTAPHNYTNGTLYYRITVTESRTGETLFTVDLSVEAEENPLTSALENWRAVQTAGTVRVLDSDGDTTQTVALSAGGNHAQRVESGGGVIILPRASGSFDAEISSLDPTIGATSAANLDSVHRNSAKELQWMEELAEDIISENADDDAVRAAKRLLSVIDEVLDASGSFRITNNQIRFTAPRNFSGSTVYYRITVYSEDTGETLLTLDISVASEGDPISDAFDNLNDALANAATDTGSDDGGSEEEEG